MLDAIVRFLSAGDSGRQPRSVPHRQRGPRHGLGILIFLVLAGTCVWAIDDYASEVIASLAVVMTVLRLVAIALFLFLLVKPVLHLTINEPVRQTPARVARCLPEHAPYGPALHSGGPQTREIATGEKASGELAINRWDLLKKLPRQIRA